MAEQDTANQPSSVPETPKVSQTPAPEIQGDQKILGLNKTIFFTVLGIVVLTLVGTTGYLAYQLYNQPAQPTQPASSAITSEKSTTIKTLNSSNAKDGEWRRVHAVYSPCSDIEYPSAWVASWRYIRKVLSFSLTTRKYEELCAYLMAPGYFDISNDETPDGFWLTILKLKNPNPNILDPEWLEENHRPEYGIEIKNIAGLEILSYDIIGPDALRVYLFRPPNSKDIYEVIFPIDNRQIGEENRQSYIEIVEEIIKRSFISTSSNPQ